MKIFNAGLGLAKAPEQSSPDEAFCQFFDDAAVRDFVARRDNGLNAAQQLALEHLLKLMGDLSNATPESIEPARLINDPRWIEIRKSAAGLLKLLRDNYAR